MALSDLEPGRAYAALVIDGISETPWVVGTLHSDPEAGPSLDIPFVDLPSSVGEREDAQFGHVAHWFDIDEPKVPKNLLLRLEEGPVMLFNCQMRSVAKQLFDGTAFARVAADHAVLAERAGDLAEQLRVQRVRSRVDGLKAWSRLSALRESVHSNNETLLTERVELVVESRDEITWRQGDATVSVQSHWEISGPDEDRRVRDDVILLTEFDEPRTVEEHLDAQRRVLTLLAVLHGTPIAFREHEVSDELFASRAGDVTLTPYRRLITRSTLREQKSPTFEQRRSVDVLATAPLLGAPGLQRWSDRWTECERVLMPLAGRLRRTSEMVEDVVVSASMSLEAAGHILPKAPNESETYSRNKPTTSTFALRSLHAVEARLPRAASSQIGIARAMADVYNTIKHYDRGALPDPLYSYLVATLAMQTARAATLKLTIGTDANGTEVPQWATVQRMFEAVDESFVRNNVYIDDDGNVVSR